MRPPSKRWPWLLVLPLLALVFVTDKSLQEQNLVRDPQTGQVMMNFEGERPRTRYRPINVLRLHDQDANVLSKISNLTPGVLLGLKSALGDILWVKADGYFHSGQYERIMPLCQLITWLDPKFLEVYIIGAWHMAYNFMDWRYIPAGTEFLKKGIHNNPTERELYFELGNMLMDKAKNFGESAHYLKEANKMGLFPAGKRHALAHALEKDGRIDETIAAWEAFRREEEAEQNWQMAHVSQHNRDLTIWRREDRKLRAQNPLNVQFNLSWHVPKQRVIRVEGTTNLPDLTKVHVMVRDKNYEQLLAEHPRLTWQTAHTTLFWDNFTVKDGKWSSWYKTGNVPVDRVDLSSEPAKYPLESEEFEVVVTINPRVEPIVIQDLTGWNGEGITGPNTQMINGVRMVRKTFTVTRAQLLSKTTPVKVSLAR